MELGGHIEDQLRVIKKRIIHKLILKSKWEKGEQLELRNRM